MSMLAICATLPGCSGTTPQAKPAESLPEEIIQQNQASDGAAEIYLAGGCFWGTELLIGNVAGVESVEVGYANGMTREPTYREVCNNSGHAEAVHVIYKPEKISLPNLLEIFYGGIRYCINSAALRFIPREDMAAQGYGDWLDLFND